MSSSCPFNLPLFEIKHNGRKGRGQRHVPINPRCVLPLFSRQQIETDHKMPHVVVSSPLDGDDIWTGSADSFGEGPSLSLAPHPLSDTLLSGRTRHEAPVCLGEFQEFIVAWGRRSGRQRKEQAEHSDEHVWRQFHRNSPLWCDMFSYKSIVMQLCDVKHHTSLCAKQQV